MAASDASIDPEAQQSSLGEEPTAHGNAAAAAATTNGAAAAAAAGPDGHYPATATAAFVADNEWVLIVMGCLLKLDGGCANNLGEAREAGFQGFRTFVLNLLIWGAVGAARLVDPKRRFGLLNRFHHEQCAQSGNFDWRVGAFVVLSSRFLSFMFTSAAVSGCTVCFQLLMCLPANARCACLSSQKIHELKDLIRKEAPSSDLDVLQLHSFLDFLQVRACVRAWCFLSLSRSDLVLPPCLRCMRCLSCLRCLRCLHAENWREVFVAALFFFFFFFLASSSFSFFSHCGFGFDLGWHRSLGGGDAADTECAQCLWSPASARLRPQPTFQLQQ